MIKYKFFCIRHTFLGMNSKHQKLFITRVSSFVKKCSFHSTFFFRLNKRMNEMCVLHMDLYTLYSNRLQFRFWNFSVEMQFNVIFITSRRNKKNICYYSCSCICVLFYYLIQFKWMYLRQFLYNDIIFLLLLFHSFCIDTTFLVWFNRITDTFLPLLESILLLLLKLLAQHKIVQELCREQQIKWFLSYKRDKIQEKI